MSERFELPCPQCSQQVAVSTDHIGKKGRCPACQAVFPITAPSNTAPSITAPSAAERSNPPPIMQSASVLEPMPGVLLPTGNSGLQPWRPAGTQPPLSGSQPLPAGLQPLPAGLQPLPAGLQPLPQLQPLPAAAPSAPQPPSLFDDLNKPRPQPRSDELPLAADNHPASVPHAGSQAQAVFRRLAEKEQWQQEKVRQDFNSLMWMGVGLMALAAIWFIGGLLLGIIFFLYPPIMFLVGLFLFFKGLFRYDG